MRIRLINGVVALIDKEDYDLVSRFSWYLTNGYVSSSVNGKTIYLHRLVMACPPHLDVDHKDLNKLNCRKTNLRNCTPSQNGANQGIRKNNKTKFKGVAFYKRDNNYSAQITVKYKKIHLGYYTTAEKAAIAYNKAATQCFGQYARLNEI